MRCRLSPGQLTRFLDPTDDSLFLSLLRNGSPQLAAMLIPGQQAVDDRYCVISVGLLFRLGTVLCRLELTLASSTDSLSDCLQRCRWGPQGIVGWRSEPSLGGAVRLSMCRA